MSTRVSLSKKSMIQPKKFDLAQQTVFPHEKVGSGHKTQFRVPMKVYVIWQ